jgi:hypothetical protein
VIAVLLRLADEIGHLLLERVEPLVEAQDRRLRRGRIVGEPGSVGGLALREQLALHLLDLLFQPIDALLGSRLRLLLGDRC